MVILEKGGKGGRPKDHYAKGKVLRLAFKLEGVDSDDFPRKPHPLGMTREPDAVPEEKLVLGGRTLSSLRALLIKGGSTIASPDDSWGGRGLVIMYCHGEWPARGREARQHMALSNILGER